MLFFIGRLALFILYFDRFSQMEINYWLSFLYGLKMDAIVACIALILPLVLLSLIPKSFSSFIARFLKVYFLSLFLFFIYIECASFPFFEEYDVRPNFIFVEYLNYPREVFSMIFSQYKLELLFTGLVMTVFGFWFLKKSKTETIEAAFELNYAIRIVLFLPLALILAIGIRSSFGHRPANLSDAMYSSSRIVNEITKNSFYSIAYAIYSNKQFSGKNTEKYGEMKISEAFQRVSKQLNIKIGDKKSPFRRLEKTHFTYKKPKNLVIFIQESLGAQFVAVTGGEKDLTPNFNRLSQEGLLFTNLYSNGTRSIRGIAGLVAGNFSIPGK
ncbi:MAG: sulfatase-like hydrolase/transferase, partial [gamma proteobacterium symbiont of Bathyaustriella thionipta]|nr:sulfatase-like hydrolase/transferase [gamma proteobacterium symbiont of Bathyaustriella thionipta]MCU7958245.1 sulfatase-like hydrolase/transferase [gamma proteobacterium symbiont of Bathyaustriella thionipta]MCU7966494.1 sulfatase-like hydrolase/transferase [gamma proteobacterium symbiont of Bathyaustriella thionipta]